MTVTATLKIVLFANDVAIAESEDRVLWQQVLSRINDGVAPVPDSSVGVLGRPSAGDATSAIAALASQLGIDDSKVVGACSPSLSRPYLHLDHHCWSSFRTNFPATGPRAVSGTVLAATMLVLWQRYAGIERVSTGDVQEIVEAVGGDGSNVARSIRRSAWLQLRDEQVRHNPAEIGRVESIFRAFCLKQSEVQSNDD